MAKRKAQLGEVSRRDQAGDEQESPDLGPASPNPEAPKCQGLPTFPEGMAMPEVGKVDYVLPVPVRVLLNQPGGVFKMGTIVGMELDTGITPENKTTYDCRAPGEIVYRIIPDDSPDVMASLTADHLSLPKSIL